MVIDVRDTPVLMLLYNTATHVVNGCCKNVKYGMGSAYVLSKGRRLGPGKVRVGGRLSPSHSLQHHSYQDQLCPPDDHNYFTPSSFA